MGPTQTRGRLPISHLSYQAMQIGRVMPLGFLKVLPGDSVGLNTVGNFRLSPLARQIAMDTRVDLVSFYVRDRLVEPKAQTIIEEGFDSTVSFDTYTADSFTSWPGFRMDAGEAIPKWMSGAYSSFWNNWVRPPGVVAEESDDPQQWRDGIDARRWGLRSAKLEHIWSATTNDTIEAADFDVAVEGGTMSLYDFEQVKARLKTEQERAFFTIRYRDIVKGLGGNTTVDVDARPQIIMRNMFWASGYDVNGTDATTLGQFAGRVTQAFKYGFPRFAVPEHGTIWTVALARFPPVHLEERHFLVRNAQPTYAEYAGDPEIIANQPPYQLDRSDVFASTTLPLGTIPYGAWYRESPHFVHETYKDVSGFPFMRIIPTSQEDAVMDGGDDYTGFFASRALGECQVAARLNYDVTRTLPTARQSLVSGY